MGESIFLLGETELSLDKEAIHVAELVGMHINDNVGES